MRLLATPVRQCQAFRALRSARVAKLASVLLALANLGQPWATGTHGSARVDGWYREFVVAARPQTRVRLGSQAAQRLCSLCYTQARNTRRSREAASRTPQGKHEAAGSPKAERCQAHSTARDSLPKSIPHRGGLRTHHRTRTMTQWSPVKGASLLVDPRAAQRKERRERRYPAPPAPPVEPPPSYDFSKRFRKPHATRGGADFGRSSVRAQRPGRVAMACCESVP